MSTSTAPESEALRDVLLDLEVADPVNRPQISLASSSVTLASVMNWSWEDTQVVAFPGMLDQLNERLEEYLDLQYSCDRSSLHLDRILRQVASIEDENAVHTRLHNVLLEDIEAIVEHGMPQESRFDIRFRSRNFGPVQPDMEVLVKGRCRWLIEVRRNLVVGPVIKSLYNAAASRGPHGAGLFVKRARNSNNVDLVGYEGANEVTLGKILKEIIKYLSAMVNYMLCVRHPNRPILYVGPPIGNAGVLKLNTPWEDVSVALAIPTLPTHRPLGLALALCVIPLDETTLVGPLPIPVHQRVPKRKASAEDAAVFHIPALPAPRMPTRSISGSAQGRTRSRSSDNHNRNSEFPVVSNRYAFPCMGYRARLTVWTVFFGSPSDTAPQLPVIRGMVEHFRLSSSDLSTQPSSPTHQIWQVCPKGSANALFTLQRCLGSGRLWDTFEIFIGESQRKNKAIVEPVPVGGYVLKVCCTPPLSDKTWAENAYTKNDARQAAAREDALYRGPLLPLQGSVVPIWKGVFSGLSAITRLTTQPQSEGLETWTVLMQNAGTYDPNNTIQYNIWHLY